MSQLHVIAGSAWLGMVVAGAPAVWAQDYPAKPIRIYTTTPGGGSDFVARIIAQGISGPLGQPVVIDNRGGGASVAEPAAKSPPDGYSLIVQGAALWILPLLQKVSWDAARDFAPITLVTREVFVLTVHPSIPANNVKELIALAKARPGELNYGSGAPGGPNRLAMELMKSMTGTNLVNVPYKGPPAAVTAQLSGEVQVSISDLSLVAPHLKSGRLRSLGVTSAEPSALTPGMPTVAATGLPGFEWIGMTGIWAPAKTPDAIITRLNQEIVRVLRQPDVKEKFLSNGAEIVGNSAEAFAAVIRSDIARVGKVIKDANIRLD
jgi:tripartite-type tricarboxylate transporter receptor subunit TctC